MDEIENKEQTRITNFSWKKFLKPTLGKFIVVFFLLAGEYLLFLLTAALPAKLSFYAFNFIVLLFSPFDINLSPLITSALNDAILIQYIWPLYIIGWIYTYLLAAIISHFLRIKFGKINFFRDFLHVFQSQKRWAYLFVILVIFWIFIPALPYMWSNYPTDTKQFGYVSPLELLLSIRWVGWNIFVTQWTILATIFELIVLFVLSRLFYKSEIIFSFLYGFTLGFIIQQLPLLLLIGQHPVNLGFDNWIYNLIAGFGIPFWISYTKLRPKSLASARAFYIGALFAFVGLTFLFFWNITFYSR